MTIGPLSPAAIGKMLNLPAVASLDAYLAIGGFPRLAQIWREGEDLWKFLSRELQNPESPLIVLGERSLGAEFPAELKARDALEAIGAGERVFTSILQRARMSNRTLETTLATLIGKRVIDKTLPYSAQARPKLSRYYVADPYLRFWLRFICSSLPALERSWRHRLPAYSRVVEVVCGTRHRAACAHCGSGLAPRPPLWRRRIRWLILEPGRQRRG